MKRQIFLLLIIFCTKIYAQNDAAALHKLMSTDSSVVPILFSYPDSVRYAILTASTYPQGFTRLDEIQKTTSSSFQKIVSKYSRNKQKELWEIIRYPELVTLLIKNKDKEKNALKELLKNYPEEINKSALYFIERDYSTLVEIENIRLDFESKYQNTVKDFPFEVRTSFTALLRNPELISILTNDIKTTVILGDLYNTNPSLVKHIADSMNSEIAIKNGEEYQEWKKGITNDEGIQKELKQVSKKYIKDEYYEDDIYTTKKYDVNVIYNIPPYPYWAGYPYWLDRPYWYPYPWWYNLGFYWQQDGTIIFLGMPTYHFGRWYYHQNRYYHRYPRTHNYFQHHYNRYGKPSQGFNRSVRDANVIIKRRR